MNSEEFGDKHTIDGIEMCIIEDNNELLERKEGHSQQIDSYRDGMYRAQKLIYVKSEEFGELPRIDAIIKYGQKNYRVTNAIDEYGIYSISLEANKG